MSLTPAPRSSLLDIPPERLGHPTPLALRLLRGVVAPLVRIAFRPTLSGVAHLPRARPFLLVANHSGGIGQAELLCFAALYARHIDPKQLPLAGFAHPVGFRFWPLTWLHRQLGSVPSTHEDAALALERGVSLLVFPGGDHEALMPIWRRDRVDFAGRTGFVKIAVAHDVPIVPMGIRGGEWTAPILLRARWLSALLVLPRVWGIKRWGVSLLGALGVAAILLLPLGWPWRLFLTWFWLTSPMSFSAFLPHTVRFAIGAPLTPEALCGATREPDAETLSRASARVEQAIRELREQPPSHEALTLK